MSRLETLPPEILFSILSFTASCSDPPSSGPHPVNSIAATSKHLYSIVEEYTRGLLKQYAGFTPPKSLKTFTCRRKWFAEICQLCNKTSKRRATLYPTLTCCRICDKMCFPKMVCLQSRSITVLRGDVSSITCCYGCCHSCRASAPLIPTANEKCRP